MNRKLLILHRDYQGSIVAITNDIGVLLEKRKFDAWGAIIQVQDGNNNVLNGLTILDRGYTGHEHLQSVGLINMNGRLYDPKLHRFLQPDNFVQDPSNTQNYNRYGYVLNNPLKYTDPSGEANNCPTCPDEADNFPDGGGAGIIKSIKDFFSNKENVEWLTRNAGQAGWFIGKNINSALKDVGGFFKRLFGGGSKGSSGPPPNMATNVNMNPYTPSGSNSFLQNGFAQSGGGMTFPSFSTLWSNYPPDVNGAHAHPSKDNYPNQCAIRVSDAFMKSGIDMSSYPKVNKTSDGYARSSKGLADWTWQNFGRPKIMSQDAFERDYKNSTGLMYIAPPPGGVGHIDLFNAGTTGSGYYLGSEIWFWPIK